MDPGITVEAVRRLKPVAMPDRSGDCHRRGLAGAVDRLQTRVPKAADGSRLIVRTFVKLADPRGCGPGVRRHVGPEPRQRLGFFQNPGELPPFRSWNAVQHYRTPDITPGTNAGHVARTSGAQLVVDQRLDVPGENTAGRQLVAISRFGKERLTTQPLGGMLHRLFERQVLERVQRIVVDENADGALRRQEVRQLVDHPRQEIVRRSGTIKHLRSRILLARNAGYSCEGEQEAGG
jgi:hypothetical protein